MDEFVETKSNPRFSNWSEAAWGVENCGHSLWTGGSGNGYDNQHLYDVGRIESFSERLFVCFRRTCLQDKKFIFRVCLGFSELVAVFVYFNIIQSVKSLNHDLSTTFYQKVYLLLHKFHFLVIFNSSSAQVDIRYRDGQNQWEYSNLKHLKSIYSLKCFFIKVLVNTVK